MGTWTLGGLPFVRTANDDKREAGADFLRVHVSQPVTVHVAFDNAYDDRPDWLRGWREQSRHLWTTDLRRAIFSRQHPAGWVTLGGNRAPDVESMYTPIFAPEGRGP